ncbi:putative signal peptide protein [Rhodopirellula islandica]|uniref:Signal peptide protein n=1 Tax=Rhodopirellula islandica TaxID=595434 RepID=A0A0J1B4E4_RHOIS|nr:putative signal peptide protein [Rhodopirellula islandica]
MLVTMIQVVSKEIQIVSNGNVGRTALRVFAAVTLVAGTLLATCSWQVSTADAQETNSRGAAKPLDARSRTIVQSVELQVKRAGAAYSKGDYETSGEALRKAIGQIDVAGNAASPGLHDALLPTMRRIINARAMLELEGVTLPPFRLPARPEATADPMSEADASSEPATDGVSFVSEVAPILVDKCGGCHIRGNKGGFTLQSFAKLMEGPSEGVVVFPGDVIGSRLIETIETGDMPRGGGKVSKEQLDTLKQWVIQGARFDGPDPAAMLTSLKGGGAAADTPAAPEPDQPTMVGKPTGNETVSFSKDVAPLLVENCNGCHLDAMQTRGGLRMDTLAQMLRGGDSGSVMQPGDGEASLLVQKLRGSAGDRMPAGGRPPLSDSDIELISTWISEGAKVDEALVQTPMKVVTAQAWLSAAASPEVSERRAEIAESDFRLAGADMSRLQKQVTDHFAVWGDVSPATLEAVAESAEAALVQAQKFLPPADGTPEDFFHGKASVYVLTKRYDYSEFAKMVEGRSVPADWQSHWKYDGIRAYVAVVASERATEEEIAQRVKATVASLAVVSRGEAVPRWFAEGLGTAISGGETKRDRNENLRRQAELVTAVGSLKSGKDFLNGKLPPERADRMAVAIAESLLSRQNRRGLDAVLRNLQSGQPFSQAFQTGMNTTPIAYVDAWLQWVQ